MTGGLLMAVNLARSNEEGNGAEWIRGMMDGLVNCDLNARYIRRKAATFLCPCPNPGIEGIFPGDDLLVDCSISPQPGHVVLVEIDGAYMVKRLIKDQERFVLIDDAGYEPNRYLNEWDTIRGVVTCNIHQHPRQ
jgi:DNA polymerase V